MRPTFLKAFPGHGHAVRGRLPTKERLMRLTTHMTSTQLPAVAVTAENGRSPACRRLMFSFTVVVLVLAVFAGSANAADVYLRAQAFGKFLTLPDTSTVFVPMWGFATCDAMFTTCDPLTATDAPGPAIALSTTDSLTIHLNNALPVPVSIMIPGQAGGGDPETQPSNSSRASFFSAGRFSSRRDSSLSVALVSVWK